MKIFGILLILAGVVALAYGGFSYTTHRRAVDMGPLKIEKRSHHRVLLPPMLGVAGILLGGAVLFGANSRPH
jgi:hypothetical protein